MNVSSLSYFSLPQCFTETTSCRQTLGNQAFFGGGGSVKYKKKEEKEVKTSYSRQEKLPMSNDNVFQN